MAGSRGLFDTNILIDYLAGLPAAIDEINRYQNRAISVVTWMEVLVGTSPQQSAEIRLILKRFELVELSPETAEVAIILRRERRIKLLDAMILASAMVGGWLLITRNTKDFQEQDGLVRIPYRL